MPEWARATLKWLGALLGMALVVAVAAPRALDELSQAVTFGDEGLLGEAESPLDAEPTSGEAAAAAILGVRDGAVAAVGPESLTLGGDGVQEVFLTFEPIPVEPACIIEVDLEIPLHEADGRPGMHLRPGSAGAVSGVQEGEAVPPEAVLDSDQPVTGRPGEDADFLRWTVTPLYTVSVGEAGDRPATLSLILAPDAEGAVTIGTLAGDVGAGPFLQWSAVADCPGDEPADA